MTFGVLAAISSSVVAAVLAPALTRAAGRWAGWLLALVPFALAGFFARFIDDVAAGEAIAERWRWIPSLGVELSFRVDGLGLLFALLITGVGGLILIFTGGYLAGDRRLGRLFLLLLLFLASMLGLVLADNMLALYVFWELTSVTSYLLIGFDHDRPNARAAALQALLATGAGGLSLLAGLLLMGATAGSYELSEAIKVDGLSAEPLMVPAMILIFLGAFTKSAQFPFHFWLPGAMEAPTPVSAYLHSATMVKAGIYLLARLSPAFAATELWFWTLTIVGLTTMIVSSWLAFVQVDLKRILAYSTVAALGTLTMLLGIGDDMAVAAAMTYLVAHALYKGALFLVAGSVDHAAGTRDVDRLGGLARVMPVTTLAAGLAALSMAGLPPLLGFLAKESAYESFLHAPWASVVVPIAVAVNVLSVAVAILVGYRPFFGRRRHVDGEAGHEPHEAPPSLWLGPLTLSGLSVAFGAAPALGIDRVLLSASTAIRATATKVPLELWHGLTPVLGLSVLTLFAGGAAYLGRDALTRRTARLAFLGDWGPQAGYDRLLRGLAEVAQAQTRLLQSGYLRFYLMIILATTAGLAGATLYTGGETQIPADWVSLHFYDVGLTILIVLATLGAVLSNSRLTAIAFLGVVGYCVALLFVLFGAPDVAMTQFLVETLTVILFVLVFYHLPPSPRLSSLAARVRDAMLAAAVGGMMTTFVLLTQNATDESPLTRYFSQMSVPGGHGRNIVNVILVDFRGLDTMGEISVLAVAAVGVYSLLKLRPRAAERERPTSTPTDSDAVHPKATPDSSPPPPVGHEGSSS